MEQMKTDEFTSLKRAKHFVELNKLEGCECPCCKQTVKIWKKRPISTAVASFIQLCVLYNNHKAFYHLDEFNIIKKDRNFSQLRLWDLIKPMEIEDKNEKRASGLWQPTETGLNWFRGTIKIPKYVFTYNNKPEGVSTETITINEALNGKFDYSELINNNFYF